MEDRFTIRLASIPPSACAVVAALVPPVIAFISTEIAPTYTCNIVSRDYFGEGLCVTGIAAAAYGLGKLIAALVRLFRGRLAREGGIAEQLTRTSILGRALAAGIGLALGFLPTPLILNPCP